MQGAQATRYVAGAQPRAKMECQQAVFVLNRITFMWAGCLGDGQLGDFLSGLFALWEWGGVNDVMGQRLFCLMTCRDSGFCFNRMS